jgi:serine/threonine-protein kinase
MLGWRNKKTGVPTFEVPPGYRDSKQPVFQIGEVIANAYQIRRLAGTSSSGQIFEAWDMLLERLVSIQTQWRDAGTPALVHEARSLAAVGAPCVPQVHGLGHHRGVDFMVLEGVVGLSLAEHIDETWVGERRMSIEEALAILVALADGLEAIHRAGLAHRDVRPENVIMSGGGRFLWTGLTRDPGSRSSLAPEIAADRPADPIRVDLYGLGAIAVELLTGKPPYTGLSPSDTLDAHRHEAVPDLVAMRAEVPTELGDLVFELMAKDPSRRPSSAREVSQQLAVIRARVQSRPRRDTVRVLIVHDDSDEVRRLWSRIRRAHVRLEVDAARNATDAIAAIRRDPPQVVLVSMDLPGSMNGFELCMYLRGSGDARLATFIALVDQLTPESLKVLDRLGVTHVLPRGPGLGDALASSVRTLADDELHPSAVTG